MTAPDERLRSSERLRRRGDFQEAYDRGRRISSRYFIAFLKLRKDGPSRVGVVASRRIGGAVRRNRAKRLLRELFRRNKPRNAVPVDVVLVARGALLDAGYEDLEDAYRRKVGRELEAMGGPRR